MTVLDAHNKLFDWFWTNDSFSLDDLTKLLMISTSPERDRAAVEAALSNLVENKVVTKITLTVQYSGGVTNYVDDTTTRPVLKAVAPQTVIKDVWVLSKPLQNYQQAVNFSANTAKMVSETLENFSDVVEQGAIVKADPFNLTETDVSKLLAIIVVLAKKFVEKS